MLAETDIAALAGELDAAERSRIQIPLISGRFPDADMGDAYRIQERWVSLKEAAGRRRIGWKIGLTSRAMQAALQIDTPDSGILFDDMAFQDGDTVPEDRFIQPRIEAEIAFVLKAPLKGATVGILGLGRIGEALDTAMRLYDRGADPVVIAQDLLDVTHWVTRVKVTPTVADDPGLPEEERSRGRALAEALPMTGLSRAWQMLMKGLTEVRMAPQPMLNDLESLYSQVRAAGLAVRVDVEPMPPANVPAAVQLAIYRVLQEALTNAIRHGNGDVEVTMRWLPDRLHLWASNPVAEPVDPPAADAAPLTDPAGVSHGIVGMRERARLVGGAVEAGMVGELWVVRATFPFAAEPQPHGSAAR